MRPPKVRAVGQRTREYVCVGCGGTFIAIYLKQKLVNPRRPLCPRCTEVKRHGYASAPSHNGPWAGECPVREVPAGVTNEKVDLAARASYPLNRKRREGYHRERR